MNDRPDDGAMARLVDAVLTRRAEGEPVPPAEELAEAHGVPVERVLDALAGLDAMGDLARNEPLPTPSLPDDYEVLGELGRGGMGIVYRAHQRSLDREVAVKVLHPAHELLGEAIERFGRETRALARLRHPHIVAIHEVGEAEGRLFFTMDLIEGQTLARFLATRKRPVPVAHAVKLVRQVADAIAFVHEHGMVHRDLKPANVLLDDAGDAFVVDFGIATDPSAGATLTATGRLMGTPAYMAPEQALGQRAKVTERTDIYSLGVMLYELVTGKPPFTEESVVATIQAVANDEPRRPSKLRRELPLPLENIIAKAMAKDPARRYGTARALEEDLGRFARGEVVSAAPPGPMRATAKFARRWRRPLAAVGVVVALILGVYAGASGDFLGNGPRERLGAIRALEEQAEWRAADLLYLDALGEIDIGTELTEAESELAFGGLSAQMMGINALDGSERRSALLALSARVEAFAGSTKRRFLVEVLRVVLRELESPGLPLSDADATYRRLSSAMRREASWLQTQRRGSRPAHAHGLEWLALAPLARRVFGREDHPAFGVVAWLSWKMVPYLPDDLERSGVGSGLVARTLARAVEREVSDRIDSGWIRMRVHKFSFISDRRQAIEDAAGVHRLVELARHGERRRQMRGSALVAACYLSGVPNLGLAFDEARGVVVDVDGAAATILANGIVEIGSAAGEERLETSARVVLEAYRALDPVTAMRSRKTVMDWFEQRLGAVGFATVDELEEWWKETARESPARLLASSLELDISDVQSWNDGADASRGEAASVIGRALRENDFAMRRRTHELLAIVLGSEVVPPTHGWASPDDSRCLTLSLLEWRERLGVGGAVVGERLSTWLVRWSGGTGRPELVVAAEVSPPAGAWLTYSRPVSGLPVQSMNPFGRTFLLPDPSRGEARWLAGDPGFVNVDVAPRWVEEGLAGQLPIRARGAAWTSGSTGGNRILGGFVAGTIPLDGRLTVIADLLVPTGVKSLDRLSVLARVGGARADADEGTIEGLAADLIDGLDRAADPAQTPVDLQLRVAARFAWDLSGDPLVDAAADKLGRSLRSELPLAAAERLVLSEGQVSQSRGISLVEQGMADLTPGEASLALERLGEPARARLQRGLERFFWAGERPVAVWEFLSLIALLIAVVHWTIRRRARIRAWSTTSCVLALTAVGLHAVGGASLTGIRTVVALGAAATLTAGWAHMGDRRPLASWLLLVAMIGMGMAAISGDSRYGFAAVAGATVVAAVAHGVQGLAARRQGDRLPGGSFAWVAALAHAPAFAFWVAIALGYDVPWHGAGAFTFAFLGPAALAGGAISSFGRARALWREG